MNNTENNEIVMSKNQTFDAGRFGSYFRYFVGSNRRRLLMSALTIVLVWTLVCVLPPAFSGFKTYSISGMDYMWVYECIWGIIMLFVLGAISGSQMYSAYHNPRGRIGLLTLPASNLEKCLTYFIIYILGFAAVFFAGAIIGDAVRVGVVNLFSSYGDAAHMRPLGMVFSFGVGEDVGTSHAAMRILSIYLGALMVIAVYGLGSILWARHAFVKTLAWCFLLNIVYSLLFTYGFKVFCGHVTDVQPRFLDWEPMTVVTWGLISGGVVCLFLLWLSYRRFTEAETIERW